MEKITKEELMAKLASKDSLENELEKIAGGDESDASIKKCMEDCMKLLADRDRCRLLCTYGA